MKLVRLWSLVATLCGVTAWAASPPGVLPPSSASSTSASGNAAPHSHGSTAQQASANCAKQAQQKQLTGAPRKQFMKDCRARQTTG